MGIASGWGRLGFYFRRVLKSKEKDDKGNRASRWIKKNPGDEGGVPMREKDGKEIYDCWGAEGRKFCCFAGSATQYKSRHSHERQLSKPTEYYFLLAACSRFSVKRILLIVGVVNTTGFLPPAAEGARATSFEG